MDCFRSLIASSIGDGQRPICRKCLTARRDCDRSARALRFVVHGSSTQRQHTETQDDADVGQQIGVSDDGPAPLNVSDAQQSPLGGDGIDESEFPTSCPVSRQCFFWRPLYGSLNVFF